MCILMFVKLLTLYHVLNRLKDLNAQSQSQSLLQSNHGVIQHAQDATHQQNMTAMCTSATKKELSAPKSSIGTNKISTLPNNFTYL